MKVLDLMGVEGVSGGMCENMTIQECITGVGEQVAIEIESFASHVGGWWDSWCDYNNIGYWIYDVTHC
jgi:hypothetical protein